MDFRNACSAVLNIGRGGGSVPLNAVAERDICEDG